MDLQAQIAKLLSTASREALKELDALIEPELKQPWRPNPGPQTQAFYSEADTLLYGGQAGGGKTELLIGLALISHHVSRLYRRRFVDIVGEGGLGPRLCQIVGSRKGYRESPLPTWRGPGGKVIEFGALEKPDAEESAQGRPFDFLGLDEGAQLSVQRVRFIMGWLRTARPGQRCRLVIATNPPRGPEGEWLKIWFQPWLDPAYPKPAKPGELRWCVMVGEKVVWVDSREPVVIDGQTYTPRSHTFIPARLDDNPYLRDSGYRERLQNLPEPLRSQLLNGDFGAGAEDAESQVIPTAWVDAAMERWKADGDREPQLSIGVDVAQGGADETTLAPLHATNWFGTLIRKPGKGTPDGPSVAGLVVQHRRGPAQIVLDCTGGWGGSARDILVQQKMSVVAFVASQKSSGRIRPGGELGFANLRAEAWWRLREALDPVNNEKVALPPDPRLKAQLISPTWKLRGTDILVESKDEIRKRLGRSTDDADAVIQAWHGREMGARAIVMSQSGGADFHAQADDEDPF